MAANRDNIPYHYYTLEEYFALEQAGDARFEYWQGEVVCMSGGSQEHTSISDDVVFSLRLRLRGTPCRVFSANQAIKTSTLQPYRYPDASVSCSGPKFEKIHGVDALVNPVLIVEVLSPSTAARDQDQKFAAYQAIPTFMEYLLISQDSVHVTHYTKQANGKWQFEITTDLEATIQLTSIDCALILAEIYENVNFGQK